MKKGFEDSVDHMGNKDFIIYGILFWGIVVSYILSRFLEIDHNSVLVEKITLVIVVVFLLEIMYIMCQKQKDWEKVIVLVLGIGFVMRVGYMLATNYQVRSHDVGMFLIDGKGHGAYIYHILQGKLPPSNELQFYQPPLYHILSAVVIRLVELLMGHDRAQSLEIAQIVSCFSSVLSMCMVRKIAQELDFSQKAQVVCLGFFALFPANILLCGYVNNDALSVFFIVLILLYTIRFYKDSSWKNTVILALAFGLGMMTKISVGVFSIPTGVVMLFVGYQKFKEKSLIPYAGKAVVFLFISLPLALWYSLRNYILFGQPLGYVLVQDKSSPVYLGNTSIKERFLSLSVGDLFDHPFADAFQDFKMFPYIVKTALFGEHTFSNEFLARGMIALFLLLLIVLLFATGKLLLNSTQQGMYRFFLPLSGIVLALFYIWFNLSYPASCSMDFRYLAPEVAIASLVLAGGIDRNMGKLSKSYGIAVWSLMILLGLSSLLFYTGM